MADNVCITTYDNPFNPHEDFMDWYYYDTQKGYNTVAYLDRVAEILKQDNKELDDDELANIAIDHIINTDPTQMYKKI